MNFKDLLSLAKDQGVIEKKDVKSITLYKAYLMGDGEIMNLPTDGELFFLNETKAIQELVNRDNIFNDDAFIAVTENVFTLTKSQFDKMLKTPMTKPITILKIILPVKDNKEKDLMPGYEGGYNEETGSIQVTLNGLIYTLDVEDVEIESIDIKTVSSQSEIKKVTKLKLVPFEVSTKKKK